MGLSKSDSAIASFVGGFRSGSTLLINLLGLHPDVAPWFETKAFCEALRWQKALDEPTCLAVDQQAERIPAGHTINPEVVAAQMRADIRLTAARLRGDEPSGKAAYERYPIGYDCVRYSVSEAEAAVDRWFARSHYGATAVTVAQATGELINTLGRRHAQLMGKPRWVNKTPEIPRFGSELRQSLGGCRVVLLIRNGYQVALSASRLHWASVEKIALWWKELINLSRAAAEPSSYLEVRYEDLIRNPAASLDRVLLFLDLEPLGKQLVAEYRRLLGPGAFKRPFRQRWESLGGRERRAFDATAGDLMRQLGYA